MVYDAKEKKIRRDRELPTTIKKIKREFKRKIKKMRNN